MPFYLHRQGVELAELSPSKVWDSEGRPDPSAYAPWECNCEACADKFARLTAERDEWDRQNAILRDTALVLGAFDTAADAHKARAAVVSPDPLVVTFKPTHTESRRWRDREQCRSAIDRLPWSDRPWQQTLDRLHFAYISVVKPGLIAYTPSEEFGHMDRQLAVRPGRYLEQFAATETGGYFLHPTGADPFTGEVVQGAKEAQRLKAERGAHEWGVTFQRDAYCAMVKALDERNTVKIATTPDDIEKVYRRGPGSCMSHAPASYTSEGHPVRVYGDSDLACAYLGDLGTKAAGPGVRARAMIWPEKKVYSRVYGDDTLRILLERDGYTKGDGASDYGNLGGARIHAICHDRDDDVWVMPYIDAACVAALSEDRKWFTLGGPSAYLPEHMGVRKTYDTRNQNGLTEGRYNESADDDDGPETYTCYHCEDNSVDDDGDLCSSCERDHHHCVLCEESFFEDGPTLLEGNRRQPICESCIGDCGSCAECGEAFSESRYSATVSNFRRAHDLENYCLLCGKGELSNLVDNIQLDAEAERRIELSKLAKARPRGTVLRVHSLDAVMAPLVSLPDRSTVKLISLDGAEVLVDVRARFGAFVVHAPVFDWVGRRGWVVSHEATGRRACRVANLTDAASLARELMTLGDWTDPSMFKLQAATVVARYAVSSRELA